MNDDAALIDGLGGPAKLAKQLGYSAQRVHNWLTRGIPPKVKLERPDLFLRKSKPAEIPLDRRMHDRRASEATQG